MADIDVGAAATDRGSSASIDGYTHVYPQNPANATGTINHIEIFMNDADTATVDVASFEQVDTSTFTTRSSSGNLTVVTGLNEFDAPEDFVAFDINEGDYIGIYGSGTTVVLERDVSGDGVWYKSGDYVPCENQLLTWAADRTHSLYAEGTISGADVTVTPDAIAITAGVQAPTINYDYVVAIGSALALTGTLKAPTINYDCVFSVLAQALAIALQDPEVGMFDGDYEEEQRPDTDFTELTKPTTSHTELEKPTTTHTELSSNLTEYTSIKWFGGYGSASYGNSPYGGAYGEYTEESKPSSDYTELTKPTTVYTEE